MAGELRGVCTTASQPHLSGTVYKVSLSVCTTASQPHLSGTVYKVSLSVYHCQSAPPGPWNCLLRKLGGGRGQGPFQCHTAADRVGYIGQKECYVNSVCACVRACVRARACVCVCVRAFVRLRALSCVCVRTRYNVMLSDRAHRHIAHASTPPRAYRH